MRRLRNLVVETCNSYSSGMVSLQLGEPQQFAVANLIEAGHSGEMAYDLASDIRESRSEAGFFDPAALLQDFPFFGAFSSLAEYIALGPTQFVGYEVLVSEAVEESETDCETAFEMLDDADAAT